MTRSEAIQKAAEHFDDGGFLEDLRRRVAIKSNSQDADFRPELYRYLEQEITETLADMGYETRVYDNPIAHGGPLLIGRRIEGDGLPTVLTYGHGDVVRGHEGRWDDERDPWTLDCAGDRWYGRGTADNKGQHSINLAALRTVLESRGRLGFNSIFFMETSEEMGSPGLAEFARENKADLSADVLVGSDGPRLQPDRATMFMGTRGALNFKLSINFRDGGHHSGNWGGLLANPGTRLAHALTTLVGPQGQILVPALKPEAGEDAPEIDPDWGEPGLTPSERVFAWNTFEVLAFETGDPNKPVNAIPPRAYAWCQIRFTADRDPNTFLPAIRQHLAAQGFPEVEVEEHQERVFMEATRLLPDHPWAVWARESIERTMEQAPNVLPNLGGSLPNNVFAGILGMPTIWVPHSYAACQQHAPNEHAIAPILREGLQIMTGLFWDLGEGETPSGATAESR
jgi:acetylornithine deacetylase/succinyl-diaminopimelate desuccinylase-like protein